MKDLDSMYRREVLGAVAAATASIAGCSEGGTSTSTTNSTDAPESSENADVSEDSTQTSTTSQQNQTQQDPVGQDIQYDGESEIEPILSQQGPWIELEHTSEQIDFPIDFSYLNQIIPSLEDETFAPSETSGAIALDSFYIALEQGEDGTTVIYNALNGEAWDTSKDLNSNYGVAATGGRAGPYTDEELQVLFSDDIAGYDDVSEDFPQEYLDLIEG